MLVAGGKFVWFRHCESANKGLVVLSKIDFDCAKTSLYTRSHSVPCTKPTPRSLSQSCISDSSLGYFKLRSSREVLSFEKT